MHFYKFYDIFRSIKSDDLKLIKAERHTNCVQNISVIINYHNFFDIRSVNHSGCYPFPMTAECA
jgi:hypothetical protein